MKREDIRKYQLVQLEILKYVANLCDKENWTYYLVWGSLIGAIREKGFIPWDADIDIAMFREDYDHLCKYFENKENEHLFLSTFRTDKNHHSPHAVLRLKGTHIVFSERQSEKNSEKYDGVYIDIFPLDNVSDDIQLQRKQIKRIAQIQRIIRYKRAIIYGKNTNLVKKAVKNVISFLFKPFSFQWLNSRMDKIYQQYNSIESKNVAMLTDPTWYPNQTFQRDIFGKGRKTEFEGVLFTVPSKAEEFLTLAYGDYMTPPPEANRYSFLEKTIEHVDYGEYGDSIKLC